MKTLLTLLGALVLGFIGGIAGHKFSMHRMDVELSPSTRAHSFELLDSSGRVAALWTTDAWGRR